MKRITRIKRVSTTDYLRFFTVISDEDEIPFALLIAPIFFKKEESLLKFTLLKNITIFFSFSFPQIQNQGHQINKEDIANN